MGGFLPALISPSIPRLRHRSGLLRLPRPHVLPLHHQSVHDHLEPSIRLNLPKLTAQRSSHTANSPHFPPSAHRFQNTPSRQSRRTETLPDPHLEEFTRTLSLSHHQQTAIHPTSLRASLHYNPEKQYRNHDPATEGSATIEIDTLIGIQDSTNGHSDSFFVSLYNQQGQFLPAIQLTNENQLYQIWRDDGITNTNTNTNTNSSSSRSISSATSGPPSTMAPPL